MSIRGQGDQAKTAIRRRARLASAILPLACTMGCADSGTGLPANSAHPIQHIIVIMQENRSFDHYFGTFQGADGIPMQGGRPTVCVPDPASKTCVVPFHDTADVNAGGPHEASDATGDIDGGRMDGFIAREEAARTACRNPTNPACVGQSTRDVMGYHDSLEIPNYWAYARQFVLQDHMFEPNASWSLPAHLFMVSEWSATCSQVDEPLSCINALEAPAGSGAAKGGGFVLPAVGAYAWTDLTYLLHKHGVTWKYYVAEGTQPDCEDGAMTCAPQPLTVGTPSIWNPLPFFTTVREDSELGNIQTIDHFFTDLNAGTLPAVSWVIPNDSESEHPPSRVSDGQAYVTSLVNAVMQSSAWSSCVILLAWDDWGGFYDHVPPPSIDENGYGLRVPGLVISPFAKHGYIDHQVLSFDAYVKFIEDVFLTGQRLDPHTDGRPDPRPTVRERVPLLGNIRADLNFNEPPQGPLILAPKPSMAIKN